MGIFSSGRKNSAPRRRGMRGEGVEQGRVERRTRRQDSAGNDAETMLLDPTLPEKQRARRRLIGAIVLVVAAVLILPLVLDSHPKPVTSDIAIEIPRHAMTGGEAPEQASSVAGATSPAADTAASSPASSAAQSTQTAASSAANAPANDTGTPAAPPGARFAVQLGAFASDAEARRWVTKLKTADVPAYVERRKQSNGSMRTLLYAGPFADREAAVAAIAKVRGAGLMVGANGTDNAQ